MVLYNSFEIWAKCRELVALSSLYGTPRPSVATPMFDTGNALSDKENLQVRILYRLGIVVFSVYYVTVERLG